MLSNCCIHIDTLYTHIAVNGMHSINIKVILVNMFTVLSNILVWSKVSVFFSMLRPILCIFCIWITSHNVWRTKQYMQIPTHVHRFIHLSLIIHFSKLSNDAMKFISAFYDHGTYKNGTLFFPTSNEKMIQSNREMQKKINNLL